MSKFKKLDSIIHVKIPAAMEVDNIRLRRLRFSDGPFIMNELKDEIILNASGLLRPINLKPIGFIGLYDLLSGESAQISLTIFDKMFRRQGYGSRAFNLLAKHLQKHSIVREIRARVMRDNHDAVSFWRKIGFSQMDTVDAIQITMSMHLKTTS